MRTPRINIFCSPARCHISLALLGLCAGCAGLDLQLHNASVQKPSNVALYFAVETSDGQPVGGLQAESFQIYEDDQLISPFESKQTILNPEVAVEHFTLLLLDLSGSITESGSMHTLMAAAGGFAEKITRTALILVGPALGAVRDFKDSALYNPAKPHVLRPVVGVDLVQEHNT